MSRWRLGLEQLRSPLARRLIVAIILFSSAITLTLTGLQLYGDYRGRLAEIDQKFAQIEQVHLKALSNSLWNTNLADLQLQLDGIVLIPSLEYVTVREGGKLWAQAGERTSADAIQHQYAMTTAAGGSTQEIGTLTVVAGLDGIYREMMIRAATTLASNALKTFLVAGFALALFHWLVSRHLHVIARHLRALEPRADAPALVLERAAIPRPDELDEIVATVNYLQQRTAADLASLRKSEARFRALVQSAADGIFALDARGAFRDTNPQWCRMLGYDREELLAMTIGAVVVPEERDRVAAEVLQLQAGRPTRCECEIRRKDGTRRRIEVEASIMLEGRVLGIARDITERKRAEQILALEHSVVRQFAEIRESGQAMKGALRAICESGQWDCGRFHWWDGVAGELRFGEAWGIQDGEIQRFIEETRAKAYGPGTGLIGAAWQSREAQWVPDVADDPRVARPAAARAAGIRATLAVPVLAGGAPIGVLMFHSRQVRAPDERLLSAIQVIALQFGHLAQRAAAERAMRESEGTLRLITDSIDEVFWMADVGETKNWYVSSAYERVWGRSCASLRENPRSFLDAVHPEDLERVMRNLERQKSGQPFFHEYRIIRPDGITRWIWDRGYPVRDGAARVTRYAGVAQDVTERVLAAAALEESKAKLRGVFAAAPIGLGKANDRGIIEVNESLCTMLGYGRDELVGRGLRFLYASAADHESGVQLARNIAQGSKGAMQSRLRRKDGGIIDVDITAVPVAAGNSAAGWVFAVADITAIKLTEKALRASQGRQEMLARRLLDAQENERRSVARELHDEVGGVLTAVKLNLLSLRGKRRGKPGEPALDDGLALVDGAIQAVRTMSLGLRPNMLDDLGLIPALKWYCASQEKRSGVAIEPQLDAIDLKTAPQLESACYRIAQEAISNVLRHAGARRIRVTLRLNEHRVALEIADDGGGFEVAAARRDALAGASGGLLGMEERALLLGGRLRIVSAPGAGTRVRAEFSLPESVFA